MTKYRSRVDYAQIHSGDKQGFNIGLDGSVFLKRETTPRVFNPPSIGTQGTSISDVNASTNISAGPDNKFNIAVDGHPVVLVTLTLAGLTTGTLIAAEMETKINAALAAAGYDSRVWVSFNAGGPDQYTIHSQFTGLTSTVVVTNSGVANVADSLKIGVANAGTEAAGTDDADFLLYTTGGPKFSQPVESNMHRSGRFHSGIIKKKKVDEFEFDTYINMSGLAGASLDNAVQLLIESALGKKTVNASTSIDFVQDLPVIFFSCVRVSTIFGEYHTGGYVKGMTITLPGNGPGTAKYSGKLSDSSIAGIATVNGAVVSSVDIIVDSPENKRYTVNARVMLVDVDGRTITAGADGSLYVTAVDDTLFKVTVNSAVSAADNSYLVPWHPGAVQQTGRDNIYTDLAGSIKLTSAGAAIDVTNIELDIQNDHNDLDNYYGRDSNSGFVAGNRMTAKVSVTFDLSNETLGEVIRTRNFGGFDPEILVGTVGGGRYLKITAPKWIVEVPPIDVPENGTTPVTLTGVLYQSVPGARDPVKLSYL